MISGSELGHYDEQVMIRGLELIPLMLLSQNMVLLLLMMSLDIMMRKQVMIRELKLIPLMLLSQNMVLPLMMTYSKIGASLEGMLGWLHDCPVLNFTYPSFWQGKNWTIICFTGSQLSLSTKVFDLRFNRFLRIKLHWHVQHNQITLFY